MKAENQDRRTLDRHTSSRSAGWPVLFWLLVALGASSASWAQTHAIFGKWQYTAGEGLWQREFTQDLQAVLTRPDGTVAWIYPFTIDGPRKVTVHSKRTGNPLRHEILADGRLDIEGVYVASRQIETPLELQPLSTGAFGHRFRFQGSDRFADRQQVLLGRCCKGPRNTRCKDTPTLNECDGISYRDSIGQCHRSCTLDSACPWTC